MGFHVYQPGSSVATSLIQAESKQKHIGLLEVKGDSFRVTPLKLETVRPFIYHQFEMKDYALSISSNEDIERIIEGKIDEMLKEKEILYKNNISLPILRVKIEISGYNMIRSNLLISKYAGKIANPADVIQYHKKTDPVKVSMDCHDDNEHDIKAHLQNLEDEMAENYDGLKLFMNESIMNFFEEKKPLVKPDLVCDALEKAVNGNEKKAVDTMFKNLFEFTIKNANIDVSILRDFSPFEKKDYSKLLMENCVKRFNKNNVMVSSSSENSMMGNNNNSNSNTNFQFNNNNNFSNFNEKSQMSVNSSNSSNSNANFNKSEKNFIKNNKAKKKQKKETEEIKEEMEVDFDKVAKDDSELKEDLMEIRNSLKNKKEIIDLGVEEEFVLQAKDPGLKKIVPQNKPNNFKINTLDRFIKKSEPSNNSFYSSNNSVNQNNNLSSSNNTNRVYYSNPNTTNTTNINNNTNNNNNNISNNGNQNPGNTNTAPIKRKYGLTNELPMFKKKKN